MDTRNKLFTIVGAVAITAAAGIGGYTLFATPDAQNAQASQVTASPISSSPSQSATSAPAASSATYKDGTYAAAASYRVPEGGQNTVNATLTITNGKIRTIQASGKYSDRQSSLYVDSFNSSVASDASGQSLASYSPSRIGGASLTTNAFDSVLDTIRTQASA